jgi:hypothetical protein
MKKIMYLCLGNAVANKSDSKYQAGDKHAIIVFKLATDTNNAKSGSIEHMESLGWNLVTIDKIAKVESETLNTAEPEVISAYEDALEFGAHGFIFSDVIE